MTKGQQLSIPMIIGGVIILLMAYRKDSFGKTLAAR
jgi:prolipoprotein diacylglyceryltransferase